MSVAAIGALAGLVVAAAEFWFIRRLSTRVELAETKRVLNVTGIVQFILLPVVGWFVAPLIAGE
ncbi:hypothetical protein [Arvimicrobium flavum]|uniref:hypothetical protein n=1 Tax=Arvimicrobium flavum TaxID=3393320 RepID=UPI00237A32AC|nr:hypothetical protein [Mesorhizobium shangrilense]